MIHAENNHTGVTATETTRIIRRGELRLLAEDLADQADLEAEAFRRGWNARGELDAKLVAHGADAALIRRQNKK